jgi:hypothetical protein
MDVSEMLKRLVGCINYVMDNLLEFFQVVVSECAGTVLLAHGVHTEEVLQWIDAKKKEAASIDGNRSARGNRQL